MTTVKGYPTKDFFVHMITRDIALDDCILDLLDNSLDGARRFGGREAESVAKYKGFHALISLSGDSFRIQDNCGGLTLDDAVEHAFRFGRRRDVPTEEFSIGLYGIGMKRAVFKMGKTIRVSSSNKKEAFRVDVDVDKWLSAEPWDFDLERMVLGEPGVVVEVRDLYPSVSQSFVDPVFVNGLAKVVARDYSFFLHHGFEVQINNERVKPYTFALKESASFKPVVHSYTDDGVMVEISGGLSGVLSDDSEPKDTAKPESEYYGWFVACNDRIVLAGDKSANTVWSHDRFPEWHPQYDGFMGFVNFKAADARLLPWTTTKREIDFDQRSTAAREKA